MKKPRFTQKHYNEIFAYTQKILNLNIVDKLGNDDVKLGIRYYHNMLGKLFYEDNPKFKPEMWRIS